VAPFIRFRLRQLIRALGIRLRAGSPVARDMDELCRHLVKLGFQPQTIVDVGVADGTIELYRHFKDPYLVLIEPMSEFKPSIDAILQRYSGESHFAAAGAEDGFVKFDVGADISALHNAKPGGSDNARNVPLRRLDTLLGDVDGPILLKVDVEGFELAVLEGGPELLKKVDVAILETRLFDVVGGTSIFTEVCAYMAPKGFEVYDIIDMVSRPLDGALVLCDIVFVRRDSILRSDNRYETQEQSRRHASRLMPTIRRLVRL